MNALSLGPDPFAVGGDVATATKAVSLVKGASAVSEPQKLGVVAPEDSAEADSVHACGA